MISVTPQVEQLEKRAKIQIILQMRALESKKHCSGAKGRGLSYDSILTYLSSQIPLLDKASTNSWKEEQIAKKNDFSLYFNI